jgi:DNA-binding NtrC family response regulator
MDFWRVNSMTADEKNRVTLVAIDDDPQSLELISESLAQEGLEILTATEPERGLELVLGSKADIALLDLVMPRLSGMEMLERIIEAAPETDVILVTGHYSTESAVEAIQKGASDYLTKPLSVSHLRQHIGKLIDEARQRRRVLSLDDQIVKIAQFEGMVGRSPAMLQMFTLIRRIAPHFSSVLVVGETGSGKELVAKALHHLGRSQAGRFAAFNCSAIVETLFESELFGHVRGAFTGATQDKVGFFEYADGGSLFLDEIGDIPLPTQGKLLRALETKEFQRVGSPAARRADVRVIAATNRNLHEMMKKGQFREDLYYRLSMVEIRVPRLADRREDLPLLERYFVGKFASEYNKEIRAITPRAQVALVRHSWPGNVRELENAIAHACMMVEREMIDIHDLPEYLRVRQPGEEIGEGDELVPLADVHRKHALHVLKRVGGNKALAAKILGINRATLYRLLKETEAPPDGS